MLSTQVFMHTVFRLGSVIRTSQLERTWSEYIVHHIILHYKFPNNVALSRPNPIAFNLLALSLLFVSKLL